MILVKILPRLASSAFLRPSMEGPRPMGRPACVTMEPAILARRGAAHDSVAGASAWRAPPASVSRKRPLRRKATACSAASAENSRPLWLASTTTWSVRPGSRVSSIATVPSWSPSKPANSAPRPCGTRPAITPTSRLALPARARRAAAARRCARASPPPAPSAACRWPRRCRVSGEPRQTTRRTGSRGRIRTRPAARSGRPGCARRCARRSRRSRSTRRGTAVSGPSATLW